MRVCQFLVGVPGIDPDIFSWQLRPDPFQKRTQCLLVCNFHRLPAKKGKTIDVRGSALFDQLILHLAVELSAVIEIPRDLVKAVLTMVRTAGNKQRGPAAGAICNIARKYLRILHNLPPLTYTADELLVPPSTDTLLFVDRCSTRSRISWVRP